MSMVFPWVAELGLSGHTVNCVNPGPVQTELMVNIPRRRLRCRKVKPLYRVG